MCVDAATSWMLHISQTSQKTPWPCDKALTVPGIGQNGDCDCDCDEYEYEYEYNWGLGLVG